MRVSDRVTHRFVNHIPTRLEERTVYVSVEFATATHLCLCGCGSEVVTPLSPTDWALTYDGASISLDPSVGSWSLPCRSHYWIRKGRVRWARQWTPEEIEAGRRGDQVAKAAYFDEGEGGAVEARDRPRSTAWQRAWRSLKGWIVR
jgi:hypothetical protein